MQTFYSDSNNNIERCKNFPRENIEVLSVGYDTKHTA